MDTPAPTAMAIAIAQQKIIVEIEADRERLDVLAKQRRDLKIALDDVSANDGGWVASTNASFFNFGKDQSIELIQIQLTKIEAELKEICIKLQGITANQ